MASLCGTLKGSYTGGNWKVVGEGAGPRSHASPESEKICQNQRFEKIDPLL